MDLEDLAAHVEEADDLCRTALDLLESLEKTIGQPLENKRSPLQDQSQESLVPCTAGRDVRGPVKSAPGDPGVTSLAACADCGEGDGQAGAGTSNSRFIARLGPLRLFELASPEMQFYLRGRAEPDRLRVHDFIWSAERRLPELGISPDTWQAALQVMGEESAMLSVLILDARKADAATPIFRPGGYLRAMTDRYRRGELHLVGSLIGLSERRGAGEAP